MNTVRPFKFEKSAACCCCGNSTPVVAAGDDKGLNIAQLAEKYSTSLYGDNDSVVAKLQGLIGQLNKLESAEAITVDDNFEMDLHSVNHCSMLQGVKGKVVVTDNTGREHHITEGETLLIPAATTLIEIDGNAEMLLAKF
ncbi:MAG: hypothetical protein Q4E41_00285 [Bacteroidales bacterium]|nr:hypothetical protein [Bacteroidales bacterium]